jgi:hypothetical protein
MDRLLRTTDMFVLGFLEQQGMTPDIPADSEHGRSKEERKSNKPDAKTRR